MSTSSGLVWGWSKAYPNTSHTSSVAFHVLTPLVHFTIHHIFPLASRFRALWSAEDSIGDGGQASEAFFMSALHAERSRDPLWLFNSAIRLVDRWPLVPCVWQIRRSVAEGSDLAPRVSCGAGCLATRF